MTGIIARCVRGLAREWRLTVGTAVTTALVVGAVGTLFLLRNALDKPIGVTHPERLHAIRAVEPAGTFALSPAPLRDAIAAAVPGIGTVCSRNSAGLAQVAVDGATAFQVVELFGPGCLTMFGVPASPSAIAAFDAAATRKGEPMVAFISDHFWRTRLGASVSAIGQPLKIGTQQVEIVGVLPATFSGLKRDGQDDILLPGLYNAGATGSATEFLVSIDPAMASAVRARLADEWPAIVAGSGAADLKDTQVSMTPVASGFSALGDRFGQALVLLERLAAAIAVFGVLSLAGLFGLSIARRQPEWQIRRALGARPRRLIAGAIATPMAATLLGGILAAACAASGARFLIDAVWTGLGPSDLDVALTPMRAVGLIGAALVLAAAAAVPAAWLGVMRLPDGLRPATTATTRSRSRQWLIGTQVAACVVFVAAAGLFGSALLRLSSSPLGFHPESVYFGRATSQPGGYTGLNEAAYFPEVLDALAAQPGVLSASMSRRFTMQLLPALTPIRGGDGATSAIEDLVSPQFFETVGITRLSGRAFTWRDDRESPPVAIVSESLARALFGRADVVGESLTTGPADAAERVAIVGVARDAMYGTLKTPERRVVYRPSLQRPELLRAPLYQIRTRDGVTAMDAVLRQTIAARGREVMAGASNLSASLRQSIVQERLLADIGGTAALLALTLAITGLYAMLAFAVQSELRELAIRSALGATRGRLGWEVARRGLALSVCGAAAGLPLVYLAGRFARHVMPALGDVSIAHASLGVATAILVGVVASLTPARVATRVNAAELMRRS